MFAKLNICKFKSRIIYELMGFSLNQNAPSSSPNYLVPCRYKTEVRVNRLSIFDNVRGET